MFGQLTGRGHERFLGARRYRQDSQRRLVGRARAVDGERAGRFREYDVGVGAAEAERVDPRDASLAVGKRATGSWNVDSQIGQRDLVAGVVEMQVRRDEAVLEHQRRFDQSGDACAGFEVPDVGFHRPDQQRTGRRAFCGERVRESPDLDRVADRGAGAVRLHIANVVGVQAGSS